MSSCCNSKKWIQAHQSRTEWTFNKVSLGYQKICNGHLMVRLKYLNYLTIISSVKSTDQECFHQIQLKLFSSGIAVAFSATQTNALHKKSLSLGYENAFLCDWDLYWKPPVLSYQSCLIHLQGKLCKSTVAPRLLGMWRREEIFLFEAQLRTLLDRPDYGEESKEKKKVQAGWI